MSEQQDQARDPHAEEIRQHLKAARSAMREAVAAILPPAYREQRRAARKEMLLAFRSMLDAALDHIEKK